MPMRLALPLILSLCVPAGAHDYWGNGKEVDVATKSLCCGQNDCKEVDINAMHVMSDGLVHFDDTKLTIPANRMMPTPDGRVWRCIWGGEIKCLFAPDPGS
jgi:hypothetical protein